MNELNEQRQSQKNEPANTSPILSNEKIANLHRRRNYLIIAIAALVLLGLCAYLFYWFTVLRFYVETEDAYVGANIVAITPHISGIPIAIYTDNARLVEKGQLLVELDSTDYLLAYKKAENALRQSVRNVLKLQQSVKENRAEVLLQKTKLSQAKYDLNNQRKLAEIRAVAGEVYEHGRNNLSIAKASLSAALHRLLAAKAELGNQELQNHPLIVKAKNALIEAFTNLERCKIRAPITGYIAKRSMEIGTWVKESTPLMAIVPLNHLWVDANFRETELENVRIGQPVTIVTDLYGTQMTLRSQVAGIVPGTGRLFSLLPPENATGNWIKVVQRIPVRIYLDPKQFDHFPLLAGISTRVTIDISDTSGNFLAQEPSDTLILSTSIYTIPLDKIEKLIDHILSQEGIDQQAMEVNEQPSNS